ncbi:MAG: ribulose-phosphate 3-epimerase [Erysipelotrichaceae bacterium]
MILAPSILSLDYSRFNESMDVLNRKCKWLHFDVMDGNFVPNLSFGPDILKCFRRNTSLFLDVHLMVKDPKFFAKVFAENGADGITFHYEALNNREECLELIEYIHSFYLKAGISIKPGTDVEEIKDLLPNLDLVLVMSVEPGFGGQSFMENSLDKVKWLKEYKDENKLNYIIEIDGGVSDKNCQRIVEAGAQALVAGSYVFKGDMEANIVKMEKMCE